MRRDNLDVINTFVDGQIHHGLHEMCLFEGNLWTISTSYNCLVESNLNLEPLHGWHLQQKGEVKSNYNSHRYFISAQKVHLGKIKDFGHFSHINSICSTNGRIAVAGSLTDLHSFPDLEVIAKKPKGATHNFYEWPDLIAVHQTDNHFVGIYRQPYQSPMWGNKFVNWPDNELKIPHDSTPPSKSSKANWGRGCCRSGNRLFVGSSPARVIEFDLETMGVVNMWQLEKDVAYAIHGLEILEE